MKITKTYDWACSGGKCPSLHMTDDGRVVVQGIRLLKDEKAVLNIPDREDAVVMDVATFRGLADQLKT